MEVEGVVAHPLGHGALLAGLAGLVGLALDEQVHDVVPADDTDDLDVPGRQCSRFPLLNSEPVFQQHFFFFGHIFNPHCPGGPCSSTIKKKTKLFVSEQMYKNWYYIFYPFYTYININKPKEIVLDDVKEFKHKYVLNNIFQSVHL